MSDAVGNLRKPEAILFDLDGTLMDSDAWVAAAARAACQQIVQLTPHLDFDEVVATNKAEFSSYWMEVEHAWTLGQVGSAQISHEVWRRTFQAFKHDDDRLVEIAIAAFSGVSREPFLFADAQELIPSLVGRFRLGLITNGASDAQREKLGVDLLRDVFDVVAISAELGIAKPSEGIFRFAVEKLGIEPERAWFVGDSQSSDIAGANALGLTSIWLNRNGRTLVAGEAQPSLQINSLKELLRFV